MALRIACFLIAGLFALLALLAISQAILIGLFHLVSPGAAWLLAALCYLIIAALAVLLVRAWQGPRRSSGLAGLTPLIGGHIQRRPARSLLMALIAGAVLEYIERRDR